MPSSNKTLNLFLNKWLGTDKPKKDDFNADNQLIDAAYKTISDKLDANAQSTGNHTGNTGIHITAQERSAWNAKDKITMGTYVGDGAGSRKITLGFAPRFGIVFTVAQPFLRDEFDIYNQLVYCAMFSNLGNSAAVAADSTGFTVTQHDNTRPNGLTYRLNENGYQYVYMAVQ